MLKNWKNLFKCYSEDPELLGLWFIAMRIVFGLLLMAGLFVACELGLLNFNADPIIFQYIPIYLGINFLWFCAGKNSRFQRVTLDIQFVIDILAITGIIFFSGGIHSELAYFYIIPIISATLISPSAPIAAWLIALIYYGALIFAEHEGLILPAYGSQHLGFQADEKIRISIFSIITTVVAFQGAYYMSRLRKKDMEVIRAKDDFIAIASHQLKSPIGSMRWSLDALKEISVAFAPKQISALSRVSDSIDRLEKVVTNLLDLSRIKAGKYVKIKQKIELLGFLDDLIKEITPYAKSMGKTVILNSRGNLYVNTDPKMLYDIAINLVTNAIKYSPSDKPVIIFAEEEKDGKYIKIRVLNLGPVISVEERKRLFEQFYRGERSKLIPTKDTGLGLYIVKLYTENLGGKIGFKSEKETGTEFWFTLPVNG